MNTDTTTRTEAVLKERAASLAQPQLELALVAADRVEPVGGSSACGRLSSRPAIGSRPRRRARSRSGYPILTVRLNWHAGMSSGNSVNEARRKADVPRASQVLRRSAILAHQPSRPIKSPYGL